MDKIITDLRNYSSKDSVGGLSENDVWKANIEELVHNRRVFIWGGEN